MKREQYKNLHRVLRKLLQGNGKIDELYGRRWGRNAGIEEAHAALLEIIDGTHGYFAVKALVGSVSEPTWYCWTDLHRGIRFENLRHAMWRRFHARRRAARAVLQPQAQPCSYISVDFLDL